LQALSHSICWCRAAGADHADQVDIGECRIFRVGTLPVVAGKPARPVIQQIDRTRADFPSVGELKHDPEVVARRFLGLDRQHETAGPARRDVRLVRDRDAVVGGVESKALRRPGDDLTRAALARFQLALEVAERQLDPEGRGRGPAGTLVVVPRVFELAEHVDDGTHRVQRHQVGQAPEHARCLHLAQAFGARIAAAAKACGAVSSELADIDADGAQMRLEVDLRAALERADVRAFSSAADFVPGPDD
jgi:hypothetical protein